MKPYFFDPSVLLLAVGDDHPDRDACRNLLDLAGRGSIAIHLSVEGGQEFLFHRMRKGSLASAVEQFRALDQLVTWHSFDAEILRASALLVASGHLRGRDAVHAATAVAAGFTTIISTDHDFNDVPGLRRLTPDALT